MKLTGKQFLLLMEVLSSTLSLEDRNLCIINREQRIRLYNEILDQQADEILRHEEVKC